MNPINPGQRSSPQFQRHPQVESASTSSEEDIGVGAFLPQKTRRQHQQFPTPQSKPLNDSSSSEDSFSVPKKPRKVVNQSSSSSSSSEDDAAAPLPGNMTFTATQVKEEVFAFQDLGGGFRKDDALDANLHRRLQEAFSSVKGLIGATGKNVQIDIDNRIVWIRDEDGSNAKTEGLDALSNQIPDLAEPARALIAIAKEIWPKTSPRSSIAPHTTPLAPSSIATKIQKDYSTCAKVAMQLYCAQVGDTAKQDKALQRITAAESIINQIQKKIDERLQIHKDKFHDTTATEQEKKNAKEAYDKLRSLPPINRLGLYVAVAFADFIGDETNAEKALEIAHEVAAEIQRSLQTHLDKVQEEERDEAVNTDLPEWVPNAIRGTPKPVQKDETHAKWAAALAYSALPEELGRKAVADYWRNEKSAAYQESVENELIQFIIRDGKTPLLDAMYDTLVADAGHCLLTPQELKEKATTILTDPNPFTAPTVDEKIEEKKNQYQF